MSKLFIHVQKDPVKRRVNYERILQRLNPTERPNKIIGDKYKTIGVSAYSKAVAINEKAIALGAFYELNEDDFNFGTPIPDGVAALVRYNNSGDLEALTNNVASRTIWFFFDDRELIISTSQRAIINILGSYDHNDITASWLLSAGNLGPGNSWDKRIRHLNYHSSLSFNFHRWEISEKSPVPLRIGNEVESNNAKDFNRILNNSLSRVNIADLKSGVTLSGGYDSRFVLGILKEKNKVESITWGTSDAIKTPDTDGYLAKLVSEKNKVPFNYYNVEWKQTDFHTFIRDFVIAGEARIDHMSNFMDNFNMWNSISNAGFDVIVRSDEVFGWLPVANLQNVRLLLEMTYLSDFKNFKDIGEYGMPECVIPVEYEMRNDETLYSYRDRLFNIYRQTFVQSAIHDLFYPYVELINPLLSDSIVSYARGLKDDERTSKALYIKAIKEQVDYLPIAKRASYSKREYVTQSKEAMAYFQNLLSDNTTSAFVSKSLLTYVESHLKVNELLLNKSDSRIKTWLSDHVPPMVKNFVRKNFRDFNLEYNLMAFRIGMLMTWVELIREDLAGERT